MAEPEIANNSKPARSHRRRTFMWVLFFAAIFMAALLIYVQLFHHHKEWLLSESKKISQNRTIPKAPAESEPDNNKRPSGWIVRVMYQGHLLLATHDQRPSWDQAVNLMRGNKAVELHCDNLEGIEQLSLVPIDLTVVPSNIAAED